MSLKLVVVIQEELQLALFQTPHGENLFLDRVIILLSANSGYFLQTIGIVRVLNV